MSINDWSFSETSTSSHFKLHQKLTKFSSAANDDKIRPCGYVSGNFNDTSSSTGGKEKDRQAILIQQAWGTAKSPARQILMSGLMMWMSGSNLTIFTLMMMGMVMLNPLTALFGVSKAFERYETPNNRRQLWLPKLAFIALNLISVGIGIWKLNYLGLLPTGQHIPPTLSAPKYMEYSQGMIIE